MATVNKLLQTMGSLDPGGGANPSQPRNWNFLKTSCNWIPHPPLMHAGSKLQDEDNLNF